MRFAALPLLTFVTNHSPAAVGAVAAATALPWLLLALPAGIMVDRMDPARVIAGANLARAFACGALLLAVTAGVVTIPLLAALGFALTTAETFADSAAQALLVSLVDEDDLERANARFVSSENVGVDLLGPLLSGGLFVLARWLPFAVSGVVFVGAAFVVLSLPGRLRAEAPAAGLDRRATERSSVTSAMRIVFTDPVLRPLVITVAGLALGLAAMEGVLVVYATGPLHLPTALFPSLLAAYSIGLLVSAALVSRAIRRFRAGPLMMFAVGVTGITLITLGTFPHKSVVWFTFAVMGAAVGLWNVLSASRRQRQTPRHMTASVSSAFRAISWGSVPVGSALGGFAASRWGVLTAFVISGLLVLLVGLAMCRSFLAADPMPIERPVDGPPGRPGDPAEPAPAEAAKIPAPARDPDDRLAEVPMAPDLVGTDPGELAF